VKAQLEEEKTCASAESFGCVDTRPSAQTSALPDAKAYARTNALSRVIGTSTAFFQSDRLNEMQPWSATNISQLSPAIVPLGSSPTGVWM
jgi:hypothetical protein